MNRRFVQWLLILLLATEHGRALADSQKRSALVIGNGAYQQQPLDNPVRDANLIAASLKQVGFEVTTVNNLGRKELFSAVAGFSTGLQKDAVAFVFFAGHGIQIGGRNYLVPVDFLSTSQQGVPARAYPVSDLFDQLKKTGAAINVVVLDACRNNPFVAQPAAKFRGFGSLGLAPMLPAKGSIVAYSTSPGQLAADGPEGTNSLYADVLSKAIVTPGLAIDELFKYVGEEVRKRSLEDQQPWFETSLTGDLVLLPLQTGSSATIGNTHSVPSGSERARKASEPWYRNLASNEWARLETDIERRVRTLTPDELPALERKGRAGNVVAQTTLGLVYLAGIDRATESVQRGGFANSGSASTVRFRPSNVKAIKWLRRAADSGFPLAQTELGELYYKGQGTDRDLEQARSWLSLAAAAGYPRAELDLAQLGVEVNPDAASLQNLAEQLKATVGK